MDESPQNVQYRSKDNSRNLTSKIVLAIASLIFGFILGAIIVQSGTNIPFLPFKAPTKENLSTNTQKIDILNLSSLPFDVKLANIRAAGILYLVQGIITSMGPTKVDNLQGVQIQLTAPTGQHIAKNFFVPTQGINIVKISNVDASNTTSVSQENQYSLSQVKVGDQVLINYYVDLKASKEQVTKVFVIK